MEHQKQIFTLYSDGACKGNPGPGGWGFWLKSAHHEIEAFGGFPYCTNHEMELRAVIEGLKIIPASVCSATSPCHVEVYTDSKYLIDHAPLQWHRRQGESLEHAVGLDASNLAMRAQDAYPDDLRRLNTLDLLWQELFEQAQGKEIAWTWVEGHRGHPGNEKADRLAKLGLHLLGKVISQQPRQEHWIKGHPDTSSDSDKDVDASSNEMN